MPKKLSLFLIALLSFSSPCLAHGQQSSKIPRVGVLLPSPTGLKTYFVAFLRGLEERGYRDGKNIVIQYRIADPKPGQYERFASELVSLNVDVIVTSSTPAIQAVKEASATIPIVMAAAADPVSTGIVKSLARPGGNITGLSMRSPEVSGKRLELLKEVVPKANRVGVFVNPKNQSHTVSLKESQIAAQTMGLQIQSIEVQSESELGRGFERFITNRIDSLTVLRESIFLIHSARIVEFAAKNGLPAIYEGREFVLAGGLMSYSTSQLDLWRRAATFVDKILKGAKPADLPVEQPMRAEFVINLKAARDIGVRIPPEVLVRADRVIE